MIKSCGKSLRTLDYCGPDAIYNSRFQRLCRYGSCKHHNIFRRSRGSGHDNDIWRAGQSQRSGRCVIFLKRRGKTLFADVMPASFCSGPIDVLIRQFSFVVTGGDDGHLCVLRPEGRRIRIVQQGRLASYAGVKTGCGGEACATELKQMYVVTIAVAKVFSFMLCSLVCSD